MAIFDYKLHDSKVKIYSELFCNAKPFPHIVIDDFLVAESTDELLSEFDDVDNWNHYVHFNERKMATMHFENFGNGTQRVINELSSPAFLNFLSGVSGVDHLIADPSLDGGGLHQIKAGGFLNVHADYQSHPVNSKWSRELNLLLYLNKDWDEDWNGKLELWDDEMREAVISVKPDFNRCVIFKTSATSMHGHPEPLTCPTDKSRKSLALYYFIEHDQALNVESTLYKPRPDDSSSNKVLIRLDNSLVRIYTYLKRYLGISDGLVSRILKKF